MSSNQPVTTSIPTAAPVSAPEPSMPPATGRIQMVDALRGAIIMIMAIDHVRDFISSAAMSFSPTDMKRTTALIFFTRWITHLCAPVFAFTAGIGAFLWMGRSRTKAELSRFLLTRGLWLMLLEVTVFRFLLSFELTYSGKMVILTVFWMLGLCMVMLAGLIHLPARALAILSLVTIVVHDLFDGVAAARFGKAAWLWNILHRQGAFGLGDSMVLVAYPLIPWVAVMAAGFTLGPVLSWEPDRRRRFLLRTGLAMSAAFVIIRAINVYGDPARWSTQPSALFTALSFLNTTKYPPSLLFLLMTLGPAIAVMAWMDGKNFSFGNPLIVFGRTPFFFFLAHIAVIHAIYILLGFFRYGSAGFLLIPPPSMGSPRQSFPSPYGYDLWVVYAVWIAVLLILYPACRWYAQLRQRRKDWWLSYL